MADRDFLRQLAGYSLTTAEIIYRMPDYPKILQTFVWQDYDMHPAYPKLIGFLNFWTGNIDGDLYRIRVAHANLIKPREFDYRSGELRLH